MDIIVYPGTLNGTVKAPPSKSLAHRALICAALSDGLSRIDGISESEDMRATIRCIEALGASVKQEGSMAEVTGIYAQGAQTGRENAEFDCGESGSTFRFMLPVAAAAGVSGEFTGRGKLPQRPVTPLADAMKANGAIFLPNGRDQMPFEINGRLLPGDYRIPGNISSQYISGLLFALPLLDGDSRIIIEGGLQSAGYVDLTVDMLEKFGIEVEKTDFGYAVKGGQGYKAVDIEVEGDYSNAAFWLVAGAMGSNIKVTGLNPESRQGDRAIVDILGQMDAAIMSTDEGIQARGYCLSPVLIDCGDIPDLVPVLTIAASTAEEEEAQCRFVNAGRLRLKESDRLNSTAAMLSKLGVGVEICGDEMDVFGGSPLDGGVDIDSYNDHRIVMSAAVAALRCYEPVMIRGAEAVSKSYPDFFDVFKSLGGRIHVI
ncbi:MAG: 3-phosphoshikimate 1-carboxyvinyltransferase [Anaerovoracaceae bacterium]|nr:3-phosphoshikimate 1-carboxyvinyltransferase [Anaerovoracaceae bacterium]